jgi:hypothetical protein
MIGRRKAKSNPFNNSLDPVEDILDRIRALSAADRDRLVRLLELWPADQFAGYKVVPKDALQSMVGGIAYLINKSLEIGQQLARTHQRKRKPSKTTLERLKKIEQWRAEKPPVSWTMIARRLGMQPDGARQLWRDARKNGWGR